MDEEAIAALADDIRQQAGQTPPIRFGPILQLIGAELVMDTQHPKWIDEEGKPHEWDGLTVCVPGEFCLIRVNGTKPRTRQRFTLAHEIGHIVRGDECQLRAYGLAPGCYYEREQEEAAHLFARHLLMPEEDVLKWWVQRPNLGWNAERFAVSRQAMWHRLLGLGLVAPIAAGISASVFA